MKTLENQSIHNLYSKIIEIVTSARSKIVQSINVTMVYTYYEIGKIIVEDSQSGFKRAEYSKETLKNLSKKLSSEFGRGYSHDNLQNMRKLYLTYSIYETPSRKFEPKLSWSHYVSLLSIDNEQERNFYEIESIKNRWTVRELNRQIDTSFYHRIAINKRDNIDELGKIGHTISHPKDVIKDPFILEFLGLDEQSSFTETELESKIIDRLEKFLLELGRGFAFVARQQRISFDYNHYYIDLVFYNWILKCFVVIDLKIGQVEHKDLGQIQTYVNYYDREIKTDSDNKTIGIVLARRKSESLVEFALPQDNTQIFASKYQLYLPSKEELKQQLESLDTNKLVNDFEI